jgi:peptide/nickel transport system substrate-binding protein
MGFARRRTRWSVGAAAVWLSLLLAIVPFGDAVAQKPEGEMRWAIYVTLAPQWFDPAEVLGQITPFWVLYAMHDALVKPMPGNLMTPSLAESWTVSPDQRTYEFKLREGLKFHNGDPFTAEDVKFSFQRTKGSKILKEKVREITVVVGDEAFKKHPIGLGPYRFVSHTPGIELIMEANEGYWPSRRTER